MTYDDLSLPAIHFNLRAAALSVSGSDPAMFFDPCEGTFYCPGVPKTIK